MTKRMMKKIVMLFFLLLLLDIAVIKILKTVMAHQPEPAHTGEYSMSIAFADETIQDLQRRHHLPSIAVALIDDQTTVWQSVRGLADIEKGIPATAETVYKQWSLAKVFTAMEVMRLVEKGVVDLDAPITTYLPDFTIQTSYPESEPITIRSILSHQSGMPRNRCNWQESGPEDADVLKDIFTSTVYCHTAFPVGERYKYSNLGPNLLGYLIEHIREESFTEHMRQSLLDPLEMTNSAFISSELPAGSQVALGYSYDKRDHIPLEQIDIINLASGNLFATLEDLEQYVKVILNDGQTSNGSILHPEMLKMMYEDQYPSSRDPQPMGLGWKIARIAGDELMVWHDGGPSEGIGTLVAILPERKLGIIMTANADSFGGNVSVMAAVEIFTQMLEEKYGKTYSNPRQLEYVAVDRETLDSYTGRYIAFGTALDVHTRKDKLFIGYYGINVRLVPIAKDTFVIRHWLLDLGITKLFKAPVDLAQLEVRFHPPRPDNEGLMIINIGGISYEICPRYPVVDETPVLWQETEGEYNLSVRLASGLPADDVFSQDQIVIKKGVILMPGVIGPLLPISNAELIILSGPFAGEKMIRNPDNGTITHQWVVYRKVAE